MNQSALKKLALVGYTAHGLVYGLVGMLAVSAAMSKSRAKGEEGVWHAFLDQPLGQMLLILMGCGLLAYAVFRTVEAIGDGNKSKGIVHRAGAMMSAFANAVLGVTALGAAVPAAKKAVGGSGHSAKSLTADALSQPFGEWLVGFVGVLLILVGIFQISLAWSLKFKEKMRLEPMSSSEQRWATRAGVVGIIARALVFIVTGGLIVRAGFNENPTQAGSMQAALQAVESQGSWYLLLLAAGLIVYAIYQFFLARYAETSR